MTDALYQYLVCGGPGEGRERGRTGEARTTWSHAPGDTSPSAQPETALDPILVRLQSADERVAQGALETLFRAVYVKLVRFAIQYVGGLDVAEDVVGDVFSSLWANRMMLATRGSLEGYLFGAVRRHAVSMYRQSLRRTGRPVPVLSDGEYWGMGATVECPDAGVMGDDVRDTLWRAIAELPARQREILTLRWQGELGWDDIARALGSTSAAVQMQHSRAAKTLRMRLAAYLR